jgi:hypothetical protein
MNATIRTSCRAAAPSGVTVADALARHRRGYLGRHGLDPVRAPVLGRVLACRTGALGSHLVVCDGCGWRGVAANSCRDRHCPGCRHRDAAAWADARQARMLQVPHFQAVFTVPSELRPLAFHNQALVYELLFEAAAGVLQHLAAERMGGRLGVTAVLHTWTAELGYHPHVHALVTGGALRHDGAAWVPSRPDFLFPGRILGALFRGRLLAALIDALGLLTPPPGTDCRSVRQLLQRVATKHRRRWVVHVEPPKGRPVEHVTRYLARYVKRVAISDARMVAVTDTHVSFRGRHGVVQLEGAEFVRRFLLHVLPTGLRKVRHYGLYAPGRAGERLEVARGLVGGVAPVDAGEREPVGETCPSCGVTGLRRVHPGTRAWLVVVAQAVAVARGPP